MNARNQIFDSRLNTVQLRIAAAETAKRDNSREILVIDAQIEKLLLRKTRLQAELEQAPGTIQKYEDEANRLREVISQAKRFRVSGAGHAIDNLTKVEQLRNKLENLLAELKTAGMSDQDISRIMSKI